MATQAEKIKSDLDTLAKDVKGKARSAYTKSSKVAGEMGDLTKQNVEAVSQSGAILGKGIKSIGSDMIEDSRAAIATFGDDIKAFAAVKSPSDVFKLQGELVARNFDAALSFGAKNARALRELSSNMFSPLTSRAKANYETVKDVFSSAPPASKAGSAGSQTAA